MRLATKLANFLGFSRPKIPNTIFWWVKHDVTNYKIPIHEGKTILPHDFLQAKFKIDTRESWVSFQSDSEDPKPRADFSCWDSSAFFVNSSALEPFKTMFQECGRTFKMRCNGELYYLVLVDVVHEAIDFDKSAYERFGLREPREADISQFKSIVLRQGFQSSDDIFRLEMKHRLSSQLVVSDEFRKRYDASGLTGLRFRSTAGTT